MRRVSGRTLVLKSLWLIVSFLSYLDRCSGLSVSRRSFFALRSRMMTLYVSQYMISIRTLRTPEMIVGNQNTHLQPALSPIYEPMTGPITGPTTPASDMTDMARPRYSSSNKSFTMPGPIGEHAVARPLRNRNAIRVWMLGLSAVPARKATKRRLAMLRTHRRP